MNTRHRLFLEAWGELYRMPEEDRVSTKRGMLLLKQLLFYAPKSLKDRLSLRLGFEGERQFQPSFSDVAAGRKYQGE